MASLECIYTDLTAARVPHVVFVHGLGGDPRQTWTFDDSTTFWPAWIGADAHCTVWTLRYDAKLTGWVDGAMPLPDQGSTILDLLESEPRLKDIPLVLVGHSMGGLVIKTAVVHAMTMGVERYEKLLKQVRAVVFIATPHFGSDLANLAKAVRALLRTNDQVSDLTSHNAHLCTLNTQFRVQQKQMGFEVRSFCESRGVFLGRRFLGIAFGPRKMVVSRSSSDPHVEGDTPVHLPEDHFSICKPKDRNAQIHTSLVGILTKFAYSATEPPEVNSAIHSEPTTLMPSTVASHKADHGVTGSYAIASVLFTVYSPEKEPYYHLREIDKQIENILNFYGAWISGPCGNGKTNLVLRNLFKGKKEFLLLDLSAAVGRKGDLLMQSVYTTIRGALEFQGFQVVENKSVNVLEDISILLIKNLGDRNMILYLDEIPIDEADEFETFIENIIAVKIKIHNTNPNSNIKFVFTTIAEPRKLIKLHQQKVYENIKFIHLDKWDSKDLEALLNKIAGHLGLDFDPAVVSEIVHFGNGTPRYVKNFIKNYIMMDSWALDRVIAETQRELEI